MKWQEFVKDYLTFTRKERIGVLVIAGLILFTLFLPDLLSKPKIRKPTQADSLWIAAVKKLEIKDSTSFSNDEQNDSNDNVFAYQFDKTKGSYGEVFLKHPE